MNNATGFSSRKKTAGWARPAPQGFASGGLIPIPELRDTSHDDVAWQNTPGVNSKEEYQAQQLRRGMERYNDDMTRFGGNRSARRQEMANRLAGLHAEASALDATLPESRDARPERQLDQAPEGSSPAMSLDRRNAAQWDLGVTQRAAALDKFRANPGAPGAAALLGQTDSALSAASRQVGKVYGQQSGFSAGGGSSLLDEPTLPGYAGGGRVVQGPKGVDKVDIKATANEYVLPVATVRAIGVPVLDAIVKATNGGQEPGPQPVSDPRGRDGYAKGGVVYGDWSPMQGALDDYVRQERQRAVYGAAGAQVPQVSDTEIANRPAPDTRYAPGGAARNLPKPVPTPATGGRETAGLMPKTDNLPERFGAMTDTGVPVDPRGRALIEPGTVPGGYAGEPAGPGRGVGAALREARMDAAVPQMQREIAQEIAAAPAANPLPRMKPGAQLVEGGPGWGGVELQDRLLSGLGIGVPRAPTAEQPPPSGIAAANAARAEGVAQAGYRAPRAPAYDPQANPFWEGSAGAAQPVSRASQGANPQALAERKALEALGPGNPFVGRGRQRPAAAKVDPRMASVGSGQGPMAAPAVAPQSLPTRADGPGGPVAFDANVPVSAADLGRQQAGAMRGSLEALRPGMNALPGGLYAYRPTTAQDEAAYGTAILGNSPVLVSPGGVEATKGVPNNLGPSLSPQGAQAEQALALARHWQGMTPKELGRLPDWAADQMGVPRQGPQAAPSLEAARLQLDAAKFAQEQAGAREEKAKDRALQVELKRADVTMEGGKQQQADAREWEKAFKAGIGDYEAAPAELGGAARPPLSAAARSFALQQGSALQQAGLPSNAALGLVMRVAPGILSEEAATAQAEADLEPWFGKADPKAVAARAAQLRSDSEAAAQQQIEAMLAQLTGGR